MPRPRFANLPIEKRERILEAAATEFAAHGFDASLNHMLEKVGVSKGAAYYYFDDKADLFVTVFEHFYGQLLDDLGALLGRVTAESFWPEIGAYLERSVSASVERPWAAGLGRAFWQLPEQARQAGPLGQLMERAGAGVAQLIRRGQELGAVRADLPGELLVGWVMALDHVTDRFILGRLEQFEASTIEAMAELSLDTLHRLLDPASGGSPDWSRILSPHKEER